VGAAVTEEAGRLSVFLWYTEGVRVFLGHYFAWVSEESSKIFKSAAAAKGWLTSHHRPLRRRPGIQRTAAMSTW
jgi:hypothetical protein